MKLSLIIKIADYSNKRKAFFFFFLNQIKLTTLLDCNYLN